MFELLLCTYSGAIFLSFFRNSPSIGICFETNFDRCWAAIHLQVAKLSNEECPSQLLTGEIRQLRFNVIAELILLISREGGGSVAFILNAPALPFFSVQRRLNSTWRI